MLAIQEFYLLTGRAIRNVARKPHYLDDIKLQMDTIGVGSIPIVLLTGFFSGAVMALQMGRALQQYGQTGRTGTVVSIILVRELGPVLTSLMVAGRNASGIASELGSMKVTEQIDAMRALGTDPVQKLVTPRMIATAIMLPCLTVIDDFVGMIGGWIIGKLVYDLDLLQYWSQTWRALGWSDVVQGLLKPFVFSFVDFADRLLLRPAHHRRHPGRGPRHHAGHGGRVRCHFRSRTCSSAQIFVKYSGF